MVHGLDQSNAHLKAAQALSAARAALKAGLPGAEELVNAEHTKYRKALQEYIDPFKRERQW